MALCFEINTDPEVCFYPPVFVHIFNLHIEQYGGKKKENIPKLLYLAEVEKLMYQKRKCDKSTMETDVANKS